MSDKKELNIENLKDASGGKVDDSTLEIVNKTLKITKEKFDAWFALNPTATYERRYKEVNEFSNEAIISLTLREKDVMQNYIQYNFRAWNEELLVIIGVY